MLISDIDIVKKYCGGLLWSPPNRGAVAFNCHAWIPEKKKCHQLWMRWVRGAHWVWLLVKTPRSCGSHNSFTRNCFPLSLQFFSTCVSFLFFPLFLLQLPCFPKSSLVLRLVCYYLQLQNKGRLLNSVLGNRPSYFREGCLPSPWVADLKGGWRGRSFTWSRGTRESTHCGSFYVGGFILWNLKKQQHLRLEWTL